MTTSNVIALKTCLTERIAIVGEARRLVAEINQLFADADHWNASHKGSEIDPDPAGELVRIRAAMGQLISAEGGA